MTGTCLHTVAALFVRHPLPGRVKTRLARDLGNDAACGLYRAMVSDVIDAVAASGLPLVLFHDGADPAGLPQGWIEAARMIFRQEGESLGERMTAAFERSFAAGATGVILAGSDIPGIDATLLRSAAESVETHDAVFAPALDGGYCLVAAKKSRFDSSIFQGIPWSTSQVLDLTLAACAASALSFHLLEPRLDIDTLDDLKAYCRTPAENAIETNMWLASSGLSKLL